MNENVIKKIVLDIDGTEIGLTPEQARKLHGAIGELLGIEAASKDSLLDEIKKIAEEQKGRDRLVPMPYPVPQPYPVWPQPRPYQPLWVYSGGTTTISNLPANYCLSSGEVKMLVQ